MQITADGQYEMAHSTEEQYVMEYGTEADYGTEGRCHGCSSPLSCLSCSNTAGQAITSTPRIFPLKQRLLPLHPSP